MLQKNNSLMVDHLVNRPYNTHMFKAIQEPNMRYPDYMTAEEIAQFELELNDRIDAENKAFHDSLERRTDEEYEPDYDGQPDEAQEWHDFDPDC